MRVCCSRRLAVAGLLLLAVFTTSCNRDARFKPTYPVRGQVLFEGKPAAGAVIAFHAVGVEDHPWTKPTAAVDEQGNFVVSTYRSNDGMPSGTYAVALTWLPAGYTGPPQKANKLPMRYADPKTSGLTADVQPTDNVLPPFNLTK